LIREAIASAPSIEQAQLAAVRELNAPEGTDVEFQVLEFPQKKVLGLFGGTQAKVRAYYEVADKPRPARQGAQKPAQKPKEQPKKSAPKPQTPKSAPAEKPAAVQGENVAEPLADAYLGRIFAALGVDDASFRYVREENDSLRIYAKSDKPTGSVIGRRGETLDAVQTLARLFLNQTDKRYSHITLEVADYRAKRADQLRHIATKTAERVLKNQRSQALDPMSPYERRIIHTVVAEIDGVESHSVGRDEGRKVLITLNGQFEERPERPARSGGFHDRPQRDFGDRPPRRDFGDRPPRRDFDRRDGGRDRKPPYQPQAPARPPRADAGGVGLYGKVEVPPKAPAPDAE
jgi:spoIIIJ-associated protein